MSRWRVLRLDENGITKVVADGLPADMAADIVGALGAGYMSEQYQEQRGAQIKPRICRVSWGFMCRGHGRYGHGKTLTLAYLDWLGANHD